jgi:hypothetical protein
VMQNEDLRMFEDRRRQEINELQLEDFKITYLGADYSKTNIVFERINTNT